MAAPTINFSGIASGIDSEGLIAATSNAARLQRVKPSQDKVSNLEETNTAFDDLTTKLTLLQTILHDNFTGTAGGGVSRSGTSSKESVITATATNAATNGSYSVTVNALAKNHTYSFDARYSATSGAGSYIQSTLTGAEPAADRTVVVTVGTGTDQETVNVVIPDGTYTCSQFVDQFNQNSSKAEANLVNVGTEASPSYAIVISSINEGIEKGQVVVTPGIELTNLVAHSESAATNASFSITGIGTITRSTNSISNVITGVTLQLVSTGSSVVKIAEDAATTTSKVQEFIDAWNDVVKFVSENNQITRQEDSTNITNVFSPLASTTTDDNALSSLRSALASSSFSGGTAVKIFADLGITTQRDGTLSFDTKKFQTAISSEPSSVSTVLQTFADTAATTGGTIDIYTRFNGIIDISINGNKTLITDLNSRISQAEAQIAQQETDMRQRFATLEATIGRLQQQQSALTSSLAGL